jgi:hypothetical protein
VNAQILIDALVQQVTVLIAQVATSGGLRAPIAHIANQVFVDLSLELEAQGVGRKVSADMFGMALRAYQRKLRRLSTRASQREQTLWSGVLEALEAGALPRKALLERFARDDGRSVRAVVRDLVDAGLVRASGQGTRVTYALAREHAANAAAGRGFEELRTRSPSQAATELRIERRRRTSSTARSTRSSPRSRRAAVSRRQASAWRRWPRIHRISQKIDYVN